MLRILPLIKVFTRFAFLSGLGWICDFVTYVLLVSVFEISPFFANFISSYVGVTFVYLTSLRFVFNKTDDKRSTFLVIYWSFQFVSILAYSALLKQVNIVLLDLDNFRLIQENSGILSKIIITPINLLTNFIFMKFLTRFMQDEIKSYA